MRTAVLRIALLLMLAWTSCPVPALAESNFSGTWILDRSKSELPRMGGRMEESAGVDVTQVINHQGTTLTVEEKVKVQGQDRSRSLTFYTDGREATNLDRRGQPVKSTSRWEGNQLVTEYKQTLQTRRGTEATIEVKEVRSLSGDGKTMTVEKMSKMPRGETKSRLVFVRQ